MSIQSIKTLLRPVSLLLVALCIFSACMPLACAVGDGSSSSEAAVITEIAEGEDSHEIISVDGEITDAQYKAYVLGCLSFFVTVILFYFSYKFLRMFF